MLEKDHAKKGHQIKIKGYIIKNLDAYGFGKKINGIKDITLIKSKKVIYQEFSRNFKNFQEIKKGRFKPLSYKQSYHQ